jgi:proliferating cell nuclear antigen PCNA
MNITIADTLKAEIFTSLFKDIKVFTNDINLLFQHDRLYIQSMDTAHVMLFEIVLYKEWFTTYETKYDKSLTLGISSVVLYRILSARDKGQRIEIIYDVEEDHLSIHFESEVKGEYVKHFEAPMMDIDTEMMDIPETENSIEITMESGLFAKLIGQLHEFGDSLEFDCSEEKITMSSKNDSSVEKMLVVIPIDDLESFSIDEGTHLRLEYSLKYLQNICKYNKIAKEIGLYINDNRPMKIVYLLTDEEDPHASQLIFHLAPKISDKDD